jgi:DNA ligase (NAD+)
MYQEFTDEQLIHTLRLKNEQYRSGDPTISDAEYDGLIAELSTRDPNHPFLNTVEPEPVTGKTVKLPEKMLSTQKAYTIEELKKWYDSVLAAASDVGLPHPDIVVKVTAKLDGFAAIDQDVVFATRGDGVNGTDLSHVRARGLATAKGFYTEQEANFGKGEIVVNKKYFEEHLSGAFENSRNVISAVIKEGELDPIISTAIAMNAVVFIPFKSLPAPQFDRFYELICEQGINDLWAAVVDSCHFDTDGLVIEVKNNILKEKMGATNHHYRWQIAYKRNTEFHNCRVTGLTWQTAKTGRITPVVNIEPTKISGVTISNVTGHHAGNVINRGIDEGAMVRVTRAGQVIPHIVDVLVPAPFDMVAHPGNCPSCEASTYLDGDNLICSNEVDCPAQVAGGIEYFFKTLGNCDGFGPSITAQIQAWGATSILDVMNMELCNYINAGIGEKTAKNLLSQIIQRQQIPVEDWRFLAAFSIPLVGRGGCEKLLAHYRLSEVFDLTIEQVMQIPGFGTQMALSLVQTLEEIRGDFFKLVDRFNIISTKGATLATSFITGKTVVFTGTMQQGSRTEMETLAKSLGAKVGSSVSSKTDYLICGANVGQAKKEAAIKHGTSVMLEAVYLSRIANNL